MLRLTDIDASYGKSQVLHRLSLEVAEGQVAALLGRNGAGKSTTLKTIIGLVVPQAGSVRFGGTEMCGMAPHRINRRGIAYVPEERRIFGHLTVDEHLAIAARSRDWTPDDVFRLFPPLLGLRSRRGRYLSGGEQQMLAIARALVTGPQLLLLDEPSQGLAPVIVDAVSAAIAAMRAKGLSILLVEQNIEMALEVADRVAIIDQGAIVFDGTPAALRTRDDLQLTYLGVGT
jgi:branched-chain amino acid transport system ATP-binding protein